MKSPFFALLLLLPMFTLADDAALSQVLVRMRHSGADKYQYQETRHMELLEVPMQTEGYMLTDAEGTLVKLQLQPNRVIMAIAGQTMFYWDPAQQQRHSAPLSYGGAAAQQIEIFRSILQGRIEELQASYDFAAENQDKQWRLQLIPKPDEADGDAPSISISGDSDDKQRQIVIRQTDGEYTEYLIGKIADEQAGEYTISSLLREVTGD